MQDLLAAPALLLQRVADETRRPAKPWVEVKRHISPRLHTAATREVYLEPAVQSAGPNSCFTKPSVSKDHSVRITI